VLRDLDLLQGINRRAPSVVAFSILTTPDAPSYAQVCQVERLAPAPEKRFGAMAKFAEADLLTGTCLMPVLPGISDDDATLESVVRWTAEHGGRFVLAGTLTLADRQKAYFLEALAGRFPHLMASYRALYPEASYAPKGDASRRLARRVRELCTHHGLSDRIPRPILPGDKHALNRRVVERLANQAYSLEIDAGPTNRVWTYRKAAWAIEEMDQDIGLVVRTMGLRGLQAIPGVVAGLASEVEALVTELGPGEALANPRSE
jgi:hypothetical protein